MPRHWFAEWPGRAGKYQRFGRRQLHVRQIGFADPRTDDARCLSEREIALAQQLAYDHATPVSLPECAGGNVCDVARCNHRQGQVRRDRSAVDALMLDEAERVDEVLQELRGPQNEHVDAR